MAQVGECTIEIGETYAKQSYRNRCEIVGAQGRLALSIPVKCPFGHGTVMYDVEIDYATPWMREHLGAIRAAYGKSAYFEHYYAELEGILQGGERFLWVLNASLLELFIRHFRLECGVMYNADFFRSSESVGSAGELDAHLDLRESIHPKRVRAVSGEYYQAFSDRHPFEGNVSALDLLMNEGFSGRSYLV